MRYTTHINKKIIFGLIFFLLVSLLCLQRAEAATMQDYCIVPPFVSQSVPPLVMLAMGRDHKVFYEAYNDAYDMDEDKRIDYRYKHSIDYYGYFDPYRCYTYNSSGTDRFVPLATPTTDKFCAAGQWSGNGCTPHITY
jgi:type IV pilus assembly protein PilY1